MIKLRTREGSAFPQGQGDCFLMSGVTRSGSHGQDKREGIDVKSKRGLEDFVKVRIVREILLLDTQMTDGKRLTSIRFHSEAVTVKLSRSRLLPRSLSTKTHQVPTCTQHSTKPQLSRNPIQNHHSASTVTDYVRQSMTEEG